MSNTTRLNLRAPEGGDPFVPGDDISINAEALDNAAIDLTGTAASRPPANTVERGTYYFANDTGDISRSDGTKWFTLTPSAFCSFNVSGDSTLTAVAANTSPIVLGLGAASYDVGGHVNLGSDRFVAPVNGRYFFRAPLSYVSDTSGVIGAYLMVNGATAEAERVLTPGTAVAIGHPVGPTIACMLELDASDYVQVAAAGNVAATLSAGTQRGAFILSFQGTLLAQLP